MTTKIITFDPLLVEDVQRVEGELDGLLNEGWEIVSALSGNRAGASPSHGLGRVEPAGSSQHLPQYKDYVVLIVHKLEKQEETESPAFFQVPVKGREKSDREWPRS